MLRQARRHRKRHGDNLFASLLAREVADGSRIVVRGELFTAFVPFAARWPVEVHIYPNRLVRNLTELNDGELDEFARIYLDVLQRFDRMYSSPLPYMSALHQFSEVQRDGYFHVELMSIRRSATKLKYLAAAESAMDAFIADVIPESVALPAPTRLSSLTMSTNPGPAEGANQVMAQEHSAGAVQFTAHNVRLDDGTLTIPESSRTLDESSWFISARGILETVFPGDKSHLRLADVGCLEGGYAVGFARMGFQVLGIEVRELNMAACNYIKSKTNLPNLRFVHDNALNIANHGLFDTVFCCGLFYHLENPKQYLETLSSVTNKLLILQTHFSIINRSDKWLRLPTTARQLTDRLLRRPAPVKFMLSAPTEHEGLPGRWFTEFSDDRSFGQRDTAKWASWDNRRSFWIQREHLLQAIKDVGVDLVMEEYDNLEPSIAESLLVGSYAANLRGTFIGIKTR